MRIPRRHQHGAWAALCLVALLAASAPAQTQLWVRQFGTSSDDGVGGLAPDMAGGAFVAGGTGGALSGTPAGGGDVFLARYTGAGLLLWVRQFGTPEVDGVGRVSSDGSGGAYLCGWTDGVLGSASAGARDAYISRYDGSGNRLWLRQFGTASMDAGHATAPDGVGGVYVAGPTSGALGAPNLGAADSYLARYDSSGALLWIRQYGGSQSDAIHGLAEDGSGGVYAGGPRDSAGTGLMGELCRYDSAGNLLWSRLLSAGQTAFFGALTPDGAGGVFGAGQANGTVGPPGHVGSYDAFVTHYDAAGTLLWARQIGTENFDDAVAVASDGAGGVFVGGYTQGSLAAPNAGSSDAYVVHYNAAGISKGATQFGTIYSDGVWPAMADGGGGVWLAGWTGGGLGGSSAGENDAWVARYGESCYADCNADAQLTVADFGCFQTRFVAADPYADCNGDGLFNVQDFGCFQTTFVTGCP